MTEEEFYNALKNNDVLSPPTKKLWELIWAVGKDNLDEKGLKRIIRDLKKICIIAGMRYTWRYLDEGRWDKYILLSDGQLIELMPDGKRKEIK